jgi:hypothetical protein
MLEALVQKREIWEESHETLNRNFKILLFEKLIQLKIGVEEEGKDLDMELKSRVKQTLEPFTEDAIRYLVPFKKRRLSATVSVTTYLRKALGGDDFVKTCVWLPQGLFVDNLVVLRKGGYPVAIGRDNSDRINLLSDIEIPSGAKLIGVIPLRVMDYCREANIVRGDVEFNLRLLKLLNIHVVTINFQQWEQMKDSERIPFLMKKVQQTDNTVDKTSFQSIHEKASP